MISSFDITIIISLFSLGLFGGFTHCIGMCGPFVLTQVSNRLSNLDIKKTSSFTKLKGIALIPYHLGRITTYSLLGATSSLFFTNLKNLIGFKYLGALALIIAAIIFIKTTIPSLKIGLPIKINLVKNSLDFDFLKRFFNKLFVNPYNFRGYILGILLGFIPCGLLYAAIIAASAIDNFLIAGLAMFCFGVATIPSLFVTSAGGYLFFQKYKKHLGILTKIVLIINSATLLIIAFGLIFNKI